MDGVELMAVMLLMMSAVSTDTSKMNQILKNAKKPVYLTYPHALDMLYLINHIVILIDATFMETFMKITLTGEKNGRRLMRLIILFLR